jgi:hypothetical protein
VRIFKMKILFSMVSLLLFVAPSAGADFTYKEYTKAPELWKRGFVFGISRYMSVVAQPDEEAPYPVRTAFQRCLASSTDTVLVREVEAYAATDPGSSKGDYHEKGAIIEDSTNPTMNPSVRIDGLIRRHSSLSVPHPIFLSHPRFAPGSST